MASKSPAEQIIQLFGGIRPMASKLDIPVTTVQGWKKRGFIPEHRYDLIREGAAEHAVKEQVAFLLNEQIIDNDEAPESPQASTSSDTSPQEPKEQPYQPKRPKDDYTPRPMPEYTFRPERQHHWVASFSVSIVSATLALAILAILFFAPDILPFVEAQNKQESQEIVRYQQTNDRLEQQLDQYHAQVENMTGRIQVLVQATQSMQNEIASLRQGGSPARIGEIEQTLATIRNSNESLRETVNALKQIEGEPTDQATIAKIHALVDAINNRLETMQGEIDSTQTVQEVMTTDLDTLQGQDMAFASMALSANNINDAIHTGRSFDGDLDVIKMLLGFDPQIANTVKRLEPYAARGIKNPNNMMEMLKMLSGDIVSAGYEGRDVSLREKALRELGKQINIRKAGELPKGESAETIVARAKIHLEEGQVDAALAELNKLDGNAKRAADPLTSEMEAYLLADHFITQLSQTLAEYVPANIMNGVVKPWLDTTRNAAQLKFPNMEDATNITIPYKLPSQGGESPYKSLKMR